MLSHFAASGEKKNTWQNTAALITISKNCPWTTFTTTGLEQEQRLHTDCVLFLLWVVNASLKCLAAILLGILFQTPFLEFSFPRIKEGFSLETVFRKGNFSHQDSSNPPSLVSWNEIKFWKVSAGITFLEENSWNLESLPTYQYCG